MPEVYKVKNYFVSNTNIPHDIKCKIKNNALINNEGYHILLNPDEECLAFGDIDHCSSTSEVMDILRDIVKTFQIESDEISYTHSLKITDGKDDHGSHWVITSISVKMKQLKKIMENTLQQTYGKQKIDTGIYKKSWFRLPNQSNETKSNIHKIIKGQPIDFLVQYKKNLEKCKYMPPDILLREEDIVEENIESSKNITNIDDIRSKVLKMTNYFDDFDSWSKLGFILHNEFNGNSDGLDLFDELSQTFKNYKGRFDVSKFYLSIKPSNKKKLSIKSLYKWYFELFPEEKTIKDESIFNDPKYLLIKEKFELRCFKLNNPISFVILEENDELQIVKLSDLKVWAKGKYDQVNIIKDGNIKPYDFVDIWINDPNQNNKNKLIFDPSMPITNNYNMFKGLNFTDGESVSEGDSKFLQLLKYICNNDSIYEYMKCWISHIVQTPWKKTNVAVILYSKIGGVGKNAIVDGLCKLFSNYSGHIESIDDITKNFNNHITNKLFIYGDEINANAKKVSDKLKQVITRPVQNLERKGFDSFQVNDYTNWLFTTNNENCFKIEDEDRRLLMIECPSVPLLKEYYINYYSEINNNLLMNKLYNFFKNYDNSKYNIGVDRVLMTDYKMKLSYENVPAYIEMFYKNPKEFCNDVFTSTQLYIKAKEYAQKNFLSSNFTVTTFGINVKKIFSDYVKRTTSCIKYNFSELTPKQFKKILYEHNKPYYLYINDFDVNDVPNFDEISS